MAILAKRLDFTGGVWQLIDTSNDVTVQRGPNDVEIVNADSIPVGDVDQSVKIISPHPQYFKAPAAGNLYVRAPGDGYLVYWES